MGIKEDLRTLACGYAKASEEAERALLTGGNYVKALEEVIFARMKLFEKIDEITDFYEVIEEYKKTRKEVQNV